MNKIFLCLWCPNPHWPQNGNKLKYTLLVRHIYVFFFPPDLLRNQNQLQTIPKEAEYKLWL